MAVTLLRVLVLGVIAAAADDVPITWWSVPRASLSCVVPDADRIPTRRPPPPLNADDKSRPKQPYIWWKGDEELKRVQSNGTVEVSRKKNSSSEGLYQCAVRHHAGLVLGYPQHLKFAYLDKQFSVHPENATAWQGQPYVLGCDINSGPAAVISWQKDGEPLPNNNRYFVLKNQLLILDVRSEDTGLYRCKATNSKANRVRVSHGGRLQVAEYPGDRDLPPSLLAIPHNSNVVAAKDEDLLLPCPVAGYPRPKLTWMFAPPGERTGELDFVDEVLVLRKLSSQDEGVYTCTVEDHSDLVKVFNVTVAKQVNITVPPTSKDTIRATTVRFNCTAIGNPTPTITWYKNGKPLELTGRTVLLASANGGERMELLIRSVTAEDAGIYQCFAHNGHSMASAWAILNVTGAVAAAPNGVTCAPVDLRHVLVRWSAVNGSMAYTVHISEPGGSQLPSQPCIEPEATINLQESLKPYKFQVQAFILASSVVSELSEAITCQGQGVPIKYRRHADKILVTWKQFAWQNPRVKEWMLQYKMESNSTEQNITLAPDFTNYTLTVAPTSSLQLRVLGTRELPWLHQNLTLVPWTAIANTSQNDKDPGETTPKIEKLDVTDVSSTAFVVRWGDDEDSSLDSFMYKACITKPDGKEDCVETSNTWVYMKDLTPGSHYSVRVKAWVPSRAHITSEFSQPIDITTPPKSAEHIKDLTYKVVNSNTLRVSWNSAPDKYTVYYSNEPSSHFSQWPSQDTFGNTILLSDVDMSKELYIVVSGYEPLGHSSILPIPVQVPKGKELEYSFTRSGVEVKWKGDGVRVVKYSQNLTQSLDKWPTVNVTTNYVHITGLNDSLSTYVMVTAPGQSATQVLNIPHKPADNSFYLSVGGGAAAALVLLAAAGALYARYRGACGARLRRRHESAADGHEEGAEMKNIGGQLANGGGSKDAGEPLLNGHVRITENPNESKTPNGRLRKGRRYEPAFDVARYDDPDATLDTVLDDSSNTFNLLDTSRRPEYDLSRSSHHLSENNSFNKLPDDNMNSELTRSTHFQLDNSKILPTLQPNG